MFSVVLSSWLIIYPLLPHITVSKSHFKPYLEQLHQLNEHYK